MKADRVKRRPAYLIADAMLGENAVHAPDIWHGNCISASQAS
ncbi:hypothetical protein [Mesorhizobium australafricanum]|uniref:Uncharacterized protein n=1 Tax=Mesorhizobium australafricanum TaxID=3072311 RepID=A0ABU4X018_9HYPH|nr:hypothetical protein [Mesorhizobium sp. VK3E]MDX8441655.1 hypothetical protein [Mesorhizobium sp. VK3E]